MCGAKTRGRHLTTPNNLQIWCVASVYEADFPRPTEAMHIAVGAAFNVVHLNSFTANAVASCLLQ